MYNTAFTFLSPVVAHSDFFTFLLSWFPWLHGIYICKYHCCKSYHGNANTWQFQHFFNFPERCVSQCSESVSSSDKNTQCSEIFVLPSCSLCRFPSCFLTFSEFGATSCVPVKLLKGPRCILNSTLRGNFKKAPHCVY